MLLTAFLLALSVSGIVWAQSETKTKQPTKRQPTASSTESLKLISFRPYLVKIRDGTSETIISTAYRNPESILKSAGFTVYPEDELVLETNEDYENNPLIGFDLIINRATAVKLSLRGEESAKRTRSSTVADLLAENGIVLGGTDKVVPALSTKLTSGLLVSVFKVGTETVTIEEDLQFSREFIDDSNMNYGSQKIKSAGANGKEKVTYEITYYDGKQVSKVRIKSLTIKEAVKEVVMRGTKGTPALNGSLTAAQIQFLGNCEAGMNPTRNSGNGYYGAFQFSLGTWNAMGTGYARADLAPLDVQIRAVQNLLSRSSIFGQFPGCANQMVANGLLAR